MDGVEGQKSPQIGPLYLKASPKPEKKPQTNVSTSKTIDVQCILCDKHYSFYTDKDDYLAHLYLEHRLVIADEEQIAILDEYLVYWREKFDGDATRLPEFCTMMYLDQLPDGTPAKQEKYYLLCDILPQDYELRTKLYKKRLENVLAQHQFERMDTNFERACLYCRDVVGPTRADYVEHLFSKHFLHLGRPEKLVYVDELIDTVQQKMTDLLCLFCEKTFKDRPTLKEHMRKKGHKRINPDKQQYDRYFLINYESSKPINHGQRSQKHKVNMKAKPAKAIASSQGTEKQRLRLQPVKQPPTEQKSRQSTTLTASPDDDMDSDWSDWEGEKEVLTCLFCALNDTDFNNIKLHITNDHGVNFDQQTTGMSFYDRVKIVNFVRRQMHVMKCVTCSEQFKTTGELQQHLQDLAHYGIGERSQWDLAEYFFPTYEDDSFLYSLDDAYDSDHAAEGNDSSIVVHSEESTILPNLQVLAEALSQDIS